MKGFQIFLSALTVFITIAAGALGTALVALQGQKPSATVVWVAVLTGLVAAMKDIRATMALPPLSNGNYDAISQLMKNNQTKTPNETDH